MTIPVRPPKPLDPLVVFALEKRHWGETSSSRQLDIAAYRDAISASEPIPTFQALNRRGEPTGRPRTVDAPLLHELLTSEEPIARLAALTQVDALIIQDLRRRASR